MRLGDRAVAVRSFGIFLVCTCCLLLPRGSAQADNGDCSQPVSSGAGPAASDCLFILKTAVGSETCEPECICAPKGTFPVTTTDALLCLRGAVGQSVSLNCPCGVTTTTTTSTTMSSFFECDVRFRMTSAAAVASLSFDVNYQIIFGLFVGDGAAVECTPLADADFSFLNSHQSKILDIGVTKETGLSGPVDLAECVYTTDRAIDPAKIRIMDVMAVSPEALPVDATVEVESVVCP